MQRHYTMPWRQTFDGTGTRHEANQQRRGKGWDDPQNCTRISSLHVPPTRLRASQSNGLWPPSINTPTSKPVGLANYLTCISHSPWFLSGPGSKHLTARCQSNPSPQKVDFTGNCLRHFWVPPQTRNKRDTTQGGAISLAQLPGTLAHLISPDHEEKPKLHLVAQTEHDKEAWPRPGLMLWPWSYRLLFLWGHKAMTRGWGRPVELNCRQQAHQWLTLPLPPACWTVVGDSSCG